MKRYSTLCIVKQMQIQTMSYYYTSVFTAKIQNPNTNCWQGCGSAGTGTAGGKAKWSSHCERQSSSRTKHTLSTQSSNCTPWDLLKRVENLSPHKSPHMGNQSSVTHNGPNLEATKVSFSAGEWKNKRQYPDSGMLSALKRNDTSRHGGNLSVYR